MKTLLKFLLLISVSATSSVSFSQETHLLKGTIGKYPVMMQIYQDATACTANYFYLSQRRDIFLEGFVKERREINLLDTTIGYEFLKLQQNATGYEGTWSNTKEVLPVKLSFISLDSIHSAYDHLEWIKIVRERDSLQYLKLAGLEMIRDSVSVNGAATLEWYHEKYSGLTMPRIKSGYAMNVLKKINDALLLRHLTESDNYLGCLPGQPNPDYAIVTNVILSTKEIFVIDLFISYYCGGAHPDFYAEGLNFDARTGEQLTLESVYRFDKKKNPMKEDTDDWYYYRDNEFSQKILAILLKLYPKQMKGDDCFYNEAEVWTFPDWYFTEKGLYVGATFSTAGRACNYAEWSVIPYHLLKQYLVMKKPFQLLVK